jgi:hypothetical protein
MQVTENACAVIILVGYLIFGFAGLILERMLSTHTRGLRCPITEEEIPTAHGKQIFRLDRQWRLMRIPVWVGSIIIASMLCSRIARH